MRKDTSIVDHTPATHLGPRALSVELISSIGLLTVLLFLTTLIEPKILGQRGQFSASLSSVAFIVHYSLLALSCAFGLQLKRRQRLAQAVLSAARCMGAMAIVTLALYFLGFGAGFIAGGISDLFLPKGGVVLVIGLVVPALAGAAWGVCFARVTDDVLREETQSRHWNLIHAFWGAVTGPLMLWSQWGLLMLPGERAQELWRSTMESPFGPASITLVAAITLVIARSRDGTDAITQWNRGSIAILGTAFMPILFFGATFVINPEGLEGIEFDCKDALLKSDAMVGVTDLRIEKHTNWWENTNTMSPGLLGAKSEPYQNPQVDFVIRFTRSDQLQRSAWARCQFAVIPESGSPPEVRLEGVRLLWEIK